MSKKSYKGLGLSPETSRIRLYGTAPRQDDWRRPRYHQDVRRLLLFLPVLLGCGKGAFNAAATKGAADTLVYPLLAKNTTLDPGKVNDLYMAEALQNVVEPLVTYSEKNEIVPCLAERWEVEDAGRSYVFHLRQGVRFTNGRPLAAADFKWNWERVLAPSFSSPAAGNYLGSIAGAADYMAGRAKTIKGLVVVDDDTLRVTLDKPRPYYLGNFTVPQAAVLAKEAAGDQEATSVEAVVGTGPFKLAKLIPDAELDLDANEDYWGGKPKVAHVRRPIVTDPSARLSRFLSGDFDYLEMSRQDAQTLDKSKAAQGHLTFIAKPQIQFLVLGERAYPPFKDTRVRQAVAMAIDRKRLVNELLAGYAEAKGLVPHGVPGYQKDYAGIAYDPAKARSLLAQAGYPGGRGLPPIELNWTTTIAENRVIAEAVATNLSNNLGLRVKPQLLEWGAYLDRQDHGRVQLGTVGWAADYLDPQNFISMQVASFGPQNKEGFKDAEIDALCLRADSELDPKLRMDLYRQAERLAVERAARIPIFMMNQPIMTSSRLKGMRTNAIGLMPLTQVDVTGR